MNHEDKVIAMLHDIKVTQEVNRKEIESIINKNDLITLKHAECSARVTTKLEDFEKVLAIQIDKIEKLSNGHRKLYGMIMGISGTISIVVTMVILVAKGLLK